MFQIGCHLSEEEIAALEGYASELEVSRTAVFSLAVQQELRAPRLARRPKRRRTHAPGAKGTGGKRVTVHIASKDLKAAFAAHADARGYGSDEAAWTVLNTELKQRTLLTTIGFAGITLDSGFTAS